MAYGHLMKNFMDIEDKTIKLGKEAEDHIKKDHPEISLVMIRQALKDPDVIMESRHKEFVNLYYLLRYFKDNDKTRPRFTQIVVKNTDDGYWISTATTRSNIAKGKNKYIKEGFDENLLR